MLVLSAETLCDYKEKELMLKRQKLLLCIHKTVSKFMVLIQLDLAC